MVDRRLGRGLDFFLSGSRKPATDASKPQASAQAAESAPAQPRGEEVAKVPVASLDPNPYQPRKEMVDAELKTLGFPVLPMERSVDTVALARRTFPGAQASLDALCRRFEIDLSRREKHGALLDAELLAEVYLQLRGGRQPDLALAGGPAKSGAGPATVQRQARPPRAHAPSPEELAAHAVLVESLNGPIWTSGD